MLASLGCRVEYLKPDWWQKALRLGKSADHGDRWKAHLKGRAQALFPRVEVTLKTADALLILEALPFIAGSIAWASQVPPTPVPAHSILCKAVNPPLIAS